MAKFVILLRQRGEGCDYTIGCGYKYVFFEAKDMEDALYQVRTKDREDYDEPRNMVWGHHVGDMEEALILPVDQMVDALLTKSNREKEEEAELQRQQEEEDRLAREQATREREAMDKAEYERLKKKFGDLGKAGECQKPS